PGFKRIVEAVCQVSHVVEDEIKRSRRSEGIQRAREIVCYISRRHSDVGLRELARVLGVKGLINAEPGGQTGGTTDKE
ncbi:MAG TPA: helix-turn-helix domain-containing protein, partial [Candidatus Binatia bacterium]|nr:helix-turn-helix domain-containing protein [Candidatus Binatia bacterium]